MTSPYNVLTANTRRGPVSPGQPVPTSVLSARPNNFLDWWSWGVAQAESSQNDPLKLHDRHRPPEPQSSDFKDRLGRRLTMRRDQIIKGQPYSVPFERYLQGHLPRSPLMSAMKTLKNNHNPTAQSAEYRIIFALLSGHTDSEIVRAVGLGGPRRDYFEAAAIRALEFVWEKAQDSLKAVIDPPTAAGG